MNFGTKNPYRPACALIAVAVANALAASAAMAQQAQTSEASLLEEVVVTARYREENLQQTPLAITAFTADSLTERNVTDVEDVGSIIPNAYFRPNGGTPVIGLRGKTNSETLSFLKPTVAIYNDGVYWARQAGMNFTLFDLERVEVLRGPQGTLFGKNSLGGAINLISKAPSGDGSGYAEVTYGNYNNIELKAGIDVALHDNLFLRATAMSQERDGYINVLDFRCQMIKEGTPELAGIGDGIVGYERNPDDPLTPADESVIDYTQQGGRIVPRYRPVMGVVGSEEDNAFSFPLQIENHQLDRKGTCNIGTQRGVDKQGVRAALRWQPTDKLDITLTGDIIDDNSEAWGNVTRYPDSNLNPMQIAYLDNFIALDAGINSQKYLAGAFYRDPRSFQSFKTWEDPIDGETVNIGERIDNRGVSLNVAYDITDNISLHYIGARRSLNTSLTASAGFPGRGSVYDEHNQLIWQHHEQTQHELRAEGVSFGGRLDWVLGAFYFKTHEYELAKTDLTEQQWAGIAAVNHDDGFSNGNQSGFGHVVWQATDNLSLSAGLRYTEESDEILFQHYPFIINIPLIKFSDQRWDWKLGADWQFNPAMMAYASVATGFRNKGFVARPWTPGQVNDVYGPYPAEEVISYELGFKGDFLNGRLRANLAAFFDEYDPRVVAAGGRGQCTTYADRSVPFPYQVGPNGGPDGTQGLIDTNGDNTGDLCPPGTPLEGTAPLNYSYNISSPAEVKGVELEMQARPFGDLLVTFTAGWNNFSSTVKDPLAAGYIHPRYLIQPELNMSAGVQYDFHVGSGALITPRLDWTFQGKQTVGNVSREPQPDQFISAYGLFNARITYMSADDKWQASVAATNLFNKFYYYNMESGQGWGVLASPGAPRMATVSLRRNF
ncbi:MAG: TonB-dependent receptor [Nevskiaceae bacterium]|jgi:iron complex outermembrane receptor protein|nr:TonB-dependent receptor [Nevskiaceae bacterium]